MSFKDYKLNQKLKLAKKRFFKNLKMEKSKRRLEYKAIRLNKQMDEQARVSILKENS